MPAFRVRAYGGSCQIAILSLFLLFAVSPAIQAAGSVSTTKATFVVVEDVIVSFSGAPGSTSDWISIATTTQTDGQYVAWQYTGGKTSGTVTFQNVEPGNYEARMYFNNTWTVEARSRFSVVFPVPTIATDKRSYLLNEKITVTYGNMPGWPKDYVTLVPAGTPDDKYGVWQFTNSARSGTMTFDPLPAGSYEARALFRNENGPVRARTSFTVGEPSPVVQTSKASYAVNEAIVVTYSGMPGFAKDWITVVPLAASAETEGEFFYLGGLKSGTLTFKGMANAGNYEARAFFDWPNGGHVIKARKAFTVTAAACTITISPASGSIAAAGGAGSAPIGVTAGDDCSWTATTSDSWITITSGASGKGKGSVTYSAAENKAGSSRTGTILIGGQTFTLTQSGATGCNFLVNPLAISAPGIASESIIQIVTALTCDWTASSNTEWIVIMSGTSGKGNGAVNIRIPQNPNPTSRTGTLTVAGQTVTVTQAAGPSCSVTIMPGSTLMAGAGGSGRVSVIADPGCAWSATPNTTWITVTSGGSGSGRGTVEYAVGVNTAPSSRTGAIIIGSQTFTITQSPAGVSPPVITAEGVVNTANYKSARPGVGTIAQGSFFSIYGSDIGPETYVRASSYPLSTSLGGVSIRITQGSKSVDAYLVFVSKGQINAILPSNAPTGEVQVTVTYGNITSAPAPVAVSATDLGLFFQREGDGTDRAIAQTVASPTEYPLNTPSRPAKPGQIIILWGTGLGAITGADHVAPGGGDMTHIAVEILVGGTTARRVYAGRQPETAAVDNVYFEVPAGVPFGCNVPVEVKAAGGAANTVVISITGQGEACR